ncbi:MAG: hypothetical protein N2691_00785 [Patescibacteria group bacterium]|nr:hypothetical protein [Patescibacteria group bacterium]
MELPDEISPVTGFLVDANAYPEYAKKCLSTIDDVLSGKIEYAEEDGEIYGTEIRKDKTRVYNMFSEEEQKVIECYIETVELKKIILAWIEELKKHQTKKYASYRRTPPLPECICLLQRSRCCILLNPEFCVVYRGLDMFL